MTVIGAIKFAISLIQQLIGLVTGIQSAQAAQATTDEVQTIDSYVQEILVRIGPNGYTLQSIAAQISTLQALMSLDVTALLAAIGNPQQTGHAVTLPSPAPAGYGGPSSSANAAAVWAYPDPVSGQGFGQLLSDSAFAEINFQSAGAGLPMATHAPFWVVTQVFATREPDPTSNLPAYVNFGTILVTDATPIAWLNRQYPGFSFHDGGSGVPYTFGGDSCTYYIPWLTQPVFEKIKAASAPASLLIPPVWPGIANVTLGAPQALVDGLLIPGPMHGLLVHIATVPYPISFYPFGPVKSFVRAGAV